MSDYLVKALAFQGSLRAYAIRTTEMVSEAQRRHDTWATASAAMGRALTASTMMAATLSGDDQLTVKIDGSGPLGIILVDANAKGETRGYVTNPHVHFELNEAGKLDVAKAVGTDGFLTIVKDLGLKDVFTGQVPLISGELGEDFTYYYAKSEQIPVAIGVGVLVNPDHSILASGGFMLQVMPGADDELITSIEKRIQSCESVSKMIEKGFSPEQILTTMLEEKNVSILEQQQVHFKCNCTRERTANAIIGLGSDEIRAMIEEDGGAETVCHFCNQTYTFDRNDLEELYTESRKKY